MYHVEIRQEGLNRHLQIAESGALLSDRKTGGALGELGERVREKITDHSTTLALSQAPDAVQESIKANGDVASLKSIKQEEKDGTVCYAVEFEKAGRNTRLKIAPDGTILEDSRK